MKESINRRLATYLRAGATAMIASAGAAAPLARAWPAEKPIVVQPATLPELARQPGLAMLLRDSDDGRALLYVEQSQGARLAIFDVTNPARIRSAGTVQLKARGPFDFVSTLDGRAELVRFREGKGDAVLDLTDANAPVLRSAERLSLQGNGWLMQDNQLVEAENLQEFNGLIEAKQIREQVTNRDTGTTFLLTQSGIYVIRRPSAERDKDRREDERRLMYSGG